jgi:hypothetical protein
MLFNTFFGIACFLLALLQSAACNPATANQNSPAISKTAVTTPTPPKNSDVVGAKGDRRNMDLLTEKVLAKDPTATLLAKQIGSSAAPSLKPLAKHEDPVVREIALRSLEQSGGEDIAEVFAEAVVDESPSVKSAALSGLNVYLKPSVYNQLLHAFDQLGDSPEVQQHVALLLGRIEGANQQDLRERYRQENNPLANEGLVAALAKLGDLNAQSKFTAGVEKSRDRERKRYIDYADYINQAWAARALAPVLADKTDMLRIGVDGMPGAVPEYLRACDLAVNVIAKIMGATFTFPVNGRTNYTDAQLKEVRQFLAR